ncbi:hypothetical protein ACIQ9Q_39100 [Streptomyces sp. NPDC094438]|uniref:hypothetical protein n=1 Tax=Streptomyces sp. NPDC094438 TaxID=3366061 RepID=UPI00381CAC4A
MSVRWRCPTVNPAWSAWGWMASATCPAAPFKMARAWAATQSPTRSGATAWPRSPAGVGTFEGFGEGEPLVRRIGDHTVVDTPLRYEAGDMKARVAFDADEKVAGIFILAPETPGGVDPRPSP